MVEMVSYRVYATFRFLNGSKMKRFLKRNKKFKVRYIPTRGWYILATDEQWEGRIRQTINYLIEQKLEE